jgi:hypothetical protein
MNIELTFMYIYKQAVLQSTLLNIRQVNTVGIAASTHFCVSALHCWTRECRPLIDGWYRMATPPSSIIGKWQIPITLAPVE